VPVGSILTAAVIEGGEPYPWAVPQALPLVAAAACAGLAAARPRWAPLLVPVAAVAAAVATVVVLQAASRHQFVPPMTVVTGVLAPTALAACVLWAGRRGGRDRPDRADRPREPVAG
jgi:protein-S-isoprenylcysteine O-methyltransferase Ste14